MPVDASPMDQRHFRNALGRYVTGVTVITTRTPEGKLEGLTANSFAAVSLDPPLVLWSLRKSSSLIAVFEAAEHFAVNVLGAWQFALAEHFAKRMPDKFENVVHAAGLRRLPDCCSGRWRPSSAPRRRTSPAATTSSSSAAWSAQPTARASR